MVDFVKRHWLRVAAGAVVVAIGLTVLIRQVRHIPDEAAAPGPLQGNVVPAQSRSEPMAQGLNSPQMMRTMENMRQEATAMERRSAPMAADSGQQGREDDDRATRTAGLRQKSTDLAQQVAALQDEEQLRQQWKVEHLQMLGNHARQMADLGSTLRHILKTPTQIRIMASDLESQARSIRSQVATLSRIARTSAGERAIWAEKRATLEKQAVDLETIGLDLQRTQGDPSRIRIVAIRIMNRGQELQDSVENMKSTSIPSNNELLSLTRQLDSVKRELQELQQE